MTERSEIDEIVGRFYYAILADESLESFFAGVDMELQVRKMGAAIVELMRPQPDIDRESLARSHGQFLSRGLNSTHFDKVLRHLDGALESAGVENQTKILLLARVEELRPDILGERLN